MVLESLAAAATTTTPSLNKGVIVRGFGEGVQFSSKKREREREKVSKHSQIVRWVALLDDGSNVGAQW